MTISAAMPHEREQLFLYQELGAAWLSTRRHALLADEPGLGKTAQAITAADYINADRILVLCPASVRINWLREFEKFSPNGKSSVALLDGASHTRVSSATRIVSCSYDLATKSAVHSTLRSWLVSGSHSIMVPDEAHFLKGVDSKRSHAVLGKQGLVHAAGRCWALSGTPAPNNLAEVWPLLRVFGVWDKSYAEFVEAFCVTRPTPHPPGYAICGHKDIPGFRKLIAPIILRRKKIDVLTDLPKILFADVTVPAGEVDEECCFPEYILCGREATFRQKLADDRAAVATLVHHIGLRDDGMRALDGAAKSVSTLRRYVGLQKVQGVIDLVTDEMASGLDKLVIFAVHRTVIENLRVGLAAFKPVTVYGGTPPAQKQKNIDKFTKDPKCRVFIGNIEAAGEGINLVAACNVLFIECMWTPARNAQAAMRVHRIGQTRPVLVRHVLLDGDELDRRVQQVLRRKTKDLVEADLL